ncbi:MAG: hypothetical protein U0166_27735 [Acidobacteriota bacterium]
MPACNSHEPTSGRVASCNEIDRAHVAQALVRRAPNVQRQCGLERIVVLQRSQERDPDGSRFRGAILAHYAHERLRAVRGALAQVVAFAGLLLGVSSIWPALLPGTLRRAALVFWAAGFLGMIAAWTEERRYRRKRDRYVDDIGVPPAT